MAALTHHGGGVDRAALEFPEAPLPWLDLSTGINPTPWQPRGPLDVDLGPLPTAGRLRALERTAAAYFNVAAECVAAVPGSEIGLRLLDRLGLPAPYRHVAPGYRTHAAAFPGSEAVAATELAPAEGTLLLANPSNPEGRVLVPETVRALAGKGWLVVDEAFADSNPENSIVPNLPERTIVLRSFGKFFGLAGVRLGFVIANPVLVERLRGQLGDWPVSTLAIAYGTAAYADREWIAATRLRLVEQAAVLDPLLMRHGLAPTGDCPLFRLVDSDRPVFLQLARAGILTRPFDYAPRWTRLGLPQDAAAFDRLDRALAFG